MFDDLTDEQLQALKMIFDSFEQGNPIHDLNEYYEHFDELKEGLYDRKRARMPEGELA